MAVNKVIVDGETKLDLTGDTVTASTLRKNITTHGANGEQIVGDMVIEKTDLSENLQSAINKTEVKIVNFVGEPRQSNVESIYLDMVLEWAIDTDADEISNWITNGYKVYLCIPGDNENSPKTYLSFAGSQPFNFDDSVINLMVFKTDVLENHLFGYVPTGEIVVFVGKINGISGGFLYAVRRGIKDATTERAGIMSAEDKSNLDKLVSDASRIGHEHNSDDIKPLQKKVYQNIIATSNTQAAATFYMLKVRPDSFYEPCTVRFKVHGYINSDMANVNKLYYDEQTISEMIFTGTGLNYRNTNALYSTSYRPYYYISAYRTTKVGYDADLSHYVGPSLLYATYVTTASLKRDFEIEILEVINGTVELLDEPVLQSAFYNSTNYGTLSNTDAYSAGTKQTGDNNSLDRLCYASFQPIAGANLFGTQLILSPDGINYFSICTSRTTATSKKCYEGGFRPEHIFYDSNSGTVTQGSRIATSAVYASIPFDCKYSDNLDTTRVVHKPIYLKCTYENGLYYLEPSGWMTQTVPTEEDGYYYIMVGYAYTTSSVYLTPRHPVYKFRNGRFAETDADILDLIGGIENGTY